MTAEVYTSRRNRKRKSTPAILWRNFKVIKPRKLIIFLVTIIIGIMTVGGGYYISVIKSTVPASTQGVSYSAPILKWQDILFAGIPGLSNSLEKSIPAPAIFQMSLEKIANRFIFFLTNIDLDDKHSFLSQEIPFLTTSKKMTAPAKSSSQVITGASLPKSFYPDKPVPKALKMSGKPLIGIYHTHTAESFIPSSGVSHKPGGQLGDIITVGDTLAKKLEERGIMSVHSKKIHDYPSFMKAYGASEITIRKMLAENPSIQAVLDIHRDAAKRQDSIININGTEFAKLSIVLATGQEDLPQPLWLQNHAFAKRIDAKLTARYPGLSKGILFSEWRYNQHLHPKALLIEVGCQENSIEEASRSMEILADILAEILEEDKI